MTKCGLDPSALASKVNPSNPSFAQIEIEEWRDDFVKTIQDSLTNLKSDIVVTH